MPFLLTIYACLSDVTQNACRVAAAARLLWLQQLVLLYMYVG